jgi:hypothetical protein
LNEAARVHHAAWQRGGGVAARDARERAGIAAARLAGRQTMDEWDSTKIRIYDDAPDRQRNSQRNLIEGRTIFWMITAERPKL